MAELLRISLFLTIILIARIVLLAALPFTAGFSGPFQSFVIAAVYIVDANSPRLHIKTLEILILLRFRAAGLAGAAGGRARRNGIIVCSL
jgi:hypothetical protein